MGNKKNIINFNYCNYHDIQYDMKKKKKSNTYNIALFTKERKKKKNCIIFVSLGTVIKIILII